MRSTKALEHGKRCTNLLNLQIVHVPDLTFWCGQACSLVRKQGSVARRCRPTGVSGRR